MGSLQLALRVFAHLTLNSQTGKIVFNTDMRPTFCSNEHTKMHWQIKVGRTQQEFTTCYKSQKYFWALSSTKILFDKEDLVKKN